MSVTDSVFQAAFSGLIEKHGRRVSVFQQNRVATKGFCYGACLDWFRKVIPPEPPLGKPGVKDRHAIDHTKDSRVDRMLSVHSKGTHGVKTGAGKIQAEAYARADSGKQAVEAERDAAIEARWQEIRDWASRNGCAVSRDRSNYVTATGSRPAEQLKAMGDRMTLMLLDVQNSFGPKFDDALKSAYAARDSWNKAIESGTEGQKLPLVWNAVAKDLNTAAAGKTRRFTDILPVVGDSNARHSSLDEFLVSAFGEPSLRPGRGLQLIVAFSDGENHSMAVHWDMKQQWTLFDPNIGVYSFATRAALLAAFLFIVEKGYVGPDVGLGSGHFWHVFCHTSDIPQASAGSPDNSTRLDIATARAIMAA
jgi:hypothetical protein